MKVFAIADLHLSGASPKPMDMFGPQWADHAETIRRNWQRTVAADDLVLIPGDISWALTLQDALPDLQWVDSLPGTKFFIRGNHDFWLGAPGKVRAALGPSTRLVRFDAHVWGGVGICGVRGWLWPGHPEYEPERDEKHYMRALARLRLSLDALAGLQWRRAVAMFHYPPLDGDRSSGLCEMVRQAGVGLCVYGHLHGEAAEAAWEGERDGVTYHCVSADRIGFRPRLLFDIT